jgi:hypothetical protein
MPSFWLFIIIEFFKTMIQRKQTLFLIFSMLIMAGYIYSPVIKIDGGMTHAMIKANDLAMNVSFPIIGHYFVFVCLIAACITIGINFLTIFLYKNRGLQIVFCWLSIVSALFSFCYAYYRMTTTELIQDQLFYYGNLSPVVAIIFVFLAIYYIRKDEDLVRSVDRLR